MMKYLSLLVVLSLSHPVMASSKGGCKVPDQGPPGPQGATGPQGPAGPQSSGEHLFVSSTGVSGVQSIAPGGTVSFNGGQVFFGPAITWNGTDTFTFTQSGHYLMTFVAYTGFNGETGTALPIGFQLSINGTKVGTTSPAFAGGVSTLVSTLVINQIISISSSQLNQPVQVVNADTSAINLPTTSTQASISFLQLTTP